eukprot:TRINITY_DN22593_c0_g2_i2.p1 TRINITY_DN22593_c0_g2~~TRINITY_DN22593_c0_g2_i2.p1  ORF type:complete len:606 (+),score=73.65 TRINITY_DN22593_c0_g2_i2:114-1820(+)
MAVGLLRLGLLYMSKSIGIANADDVCDGLPRDVAITAATGMPWFALEPFVKSFRYFSHACTSLVMFISEQTTPDLEEKLRNHRVTPIRLSEAWPYIPAEYLHAYSSPAELVPKDIAGLVNAGGRNGGINTLRYLAAKAYLESTAKLGSDSLVILSDTRDVLFQADPFAAVQALRGTDGVWLHEEHPDRKIEECPWNRGQAEFFGSAFDKEAKEQTFVNGGVVIGSQGGVIHLITALGDVLRRFKDTELNDQGVLNFIMHAREASSLRWPGLNMVQHGSGAVRNVGSELFGWKGVAYTHPPKLRDVQMGFDDEGFAAVLQADKSTAAIVHQYDRHDMLKHLLQERWSGVTSENWRAIAASANFTNVLELEEVMRMVTSHFWRHHGGGCAERTLGLRFGPLFDHTGSFFSRPSEVAWIAAECLHLTDSLPVIMSVNLDGLHIRLSREGVLDKKVSKLIRTMKTLLYHGDAEPLSFHKPKGLISTRATVQLCLDWTCREADVEERAKVAWAMYVESLVEGKMEAMAAYKPMPHERFLRGISWRGDQEETVTGNISSQIRAFRWTKLPGEPS